MKKAVAFIIVLTTLVLVFYGLFQLSTNPQAEKTRDALVKKISSSCRGIQTSIATSRRPPLSTIELEEHLKNNLGRPFAGFTREDWQWFWKLLYAKNTQEKLGWINYKRQFTKEEVESSLAYNLGEPFSRFREREWAIFWQHILQGKVFK